MGQAQSCQHGIELSDSVKRAMNFLTKWAIIRYSEMILLCGVCPISTGSYECRMKRHTNRLHQQHEWTLLGKVSLPCCDLLTTTYVIFGRQFSSCTFTIPSNQRFMSSHILSTQTCYLFIRPANDCAWQVTRCCSVSMRLVSMVSGKWEEENLQLVNGAAACRRTSSPLDNGQTHIALLLLLHMPLFSA
jgi:hypothetical protein